MGVQKPAMEKLAKGIEEGRRHQTLMGVTGSGKTFTMAGLIEKAQKPTLVISHNKTLAGQLYGEFKEFFPKMPSNILFPTTIITSRRHIFRLRIPT